MGRKEGMCSLNDSLLELLAKDIIEPAEAYQKASAKDELLRRMGSIPHCRSPKGTPWTEEDLLQAAEHFYEPGNGNGSDSLPPPPPIASRGIASREPALAGN
jgi:hypothetical protein